MYLEQLGFQGKIITYMYALFPTSPSGKETMKYWLTNNQTTVCAFVRFAMLLLIAKTQNVKGSH